MCHHISIGATPHLSALRLPRTFKSYPLWCGELQELFPQSPVLPLFPLDHDEDDHGEKVEHHQEPAADTDGQVISLSQTPVLVRLRACKAAAAW